MYGEMPEKGNGIKMFYRTPAPIFLTPMEVLDILRQ
jgi:hypothetical protein